MRADTKMAIVVPLFASIGSAGGFMASSEAGKDPFIGTIIGSAAGALMGFLVTVPPRQNGVPGALSGLPLHDARFP